MERKKGGNVERKNKNCTETFRQKDKHRKIIYKKMGKR